MIPRYVLLLLLSLCATAQAQLEDELGLGGDKTLTRVTARLPACLVAGQTFELQVIFDIPKGFHLYGPKEKDWIPTAVAVANTGNLTFGKPIYPKGVVKKIPDLGTATMYTGRVVVRIPGKVSATPNYVDGRQKIALKTAWGTCNDDVCKESRFLGRNPYKLSLRTRIVLTRPSLSAPATAAPGKTFELKIAFKIPPKHHIYGPTAKQFQPLTVKLPAIKGLRWGKPVFPKTQKNKYTGVVSVTVTGTIDASAKLGPRALQVLLGWGTCDANACYEAVRNFRLTRGILIK